MSDDILKLMEEDFEQEFASNLEKADGGILRTVAELARAIAAKEAEVADIERQLKDSKKELLKLSIRDISHESEHEKDREVISLLRSGKRNMFRAKSSM